MRLGAAPSEKMDKLKNILKSPLLRKMLIGALIAGASYYIGPEAAMQLIGAIFGAE